jgi:hypothetical protein
MSSTAAPAVDARVRKGENMWKKGLLPFAFLLAITIACRADQLAYNSLENSRRAVDLIQPNSTLVSYCSLCDSQTVEVWQVRKAVVTVTEDRKHYEVQVFGKRLFKSRKKFDKGHYKEPVEYRRVGADVKGGKWFLEPIDLAYVYVPVEDGSFQNAAMVLGLKAKTKVDVIRLPADVTTQVGQEIAATSAEAATARDE